MIGELHLLSGNDIPFPEAQLTIHQPTLKEIAFLGEEQFFIGCGFLNFSKDLLGAQDKTKLANYDDFEIFMTIMMKPVQDAQKSINAAFLVLELIFPLYTASVREGCIVLTKESEERFITKNNFQAFKNILVAMFNLNLGGNAQNGYNPEGDMAKRIADKLKKRHEKLLELSGTDGKRVAILSRYASILAIGLQKSLNEIMQWTVYQLYDEFQRFQLKMQWDAYVQARIAGAKDLEEVDNWMIDLRDSGKKKEKNKNKK